VKISRGKLGNGVGFWGSRLESWKWRGVFVEGWKWPKVLGAFRVFERHFFTTETQRGGNAKAQWRKDANGKRGADGRVPVLVFPCSLFRYIAGLYLFSCGEFGFRLAEAELRAAE
jgi:hypothetical protein